MGIYPNAYYQYLKHAKAGYYRNKNHIYSKIRQIYHELGGITGYRTMKVLLERENIFLSRVTVHKYMNRELNLRCICRRHRPEYRKGHAHEIFPNLLQQNFITEQRNHIWCTDFTYMFLKNGSVRFNCTIIDLYDRSVVASENGNQITSDLAIRTLEKAVCYSK